MLNRIVWNRTVLTSCIQQHTKRNQEETVKMQNTRLKKMVKFTKPFSSAYQLTIIMYINYYYAYKLLLCI